ncbi:formylglycine-generating enzyme family protein [Phormidium sp. FACHB-592]|nr:formylglycine-generating enzyme family protein [Phormidium sp. FACHB-592]
MPGAPNPKLQIRELPARTEIAPADTLTVPIVTLTAKALKQWALVVAAAGRQRSPARLFDLSWVKDPERDRSLAVIQPQSPEARVELFMATASPLAQRLACMMAAVPVELPVVHLIQQELLPEMQSVHVAEVYSSSLLEDVQANPVKPDVPARYDFVKEVRGVLNEITPLDETLGVLEALSRRIARTLGFEIRSFTALLSPKSDWSQETKDAILPFAQIATEVLHRLGGDYAELAQLVEQDAKGYSNWIQPLEPEPSFPDLEVLEFTTAQLVEPSAEPLFPPLQMQDVEIVTILIEAQPDGLEPFEFVVATLEREIEPRPSGSSSVSPMPPSLLGLPPPLPGLSSSVPPSSPSDFPQNLSQRSESGNKWVIRRQTQPAWQWVEQLDNHIQLEMVAIPAGCFMMGSPEDEPERSAAEGPQHEVRLDSFMMGRYPVTQAQWRVVAAMPQINRALKPNPSQFKGDKRPVEQVSWYDAVEFCDRISVHIGQDYRLPMEAEWEYACRAGTITPFHFGKTISPELANYDGSNVYDGGPNGNYWEEATPVDHFGIANTFGLCDMHGNVWEWCQDHWQGNYEGAPTDGSAWVSKNEKAARVRRGGSWRDGPWYCRSASRFNAKPDDRYLNFGFRVVRSAP